MRSDRCLGLAAKREQAVEADVAEPEAGPEDDSDEGRDEGTAEGLAVAEIDAGGSAEIGGEEDGSGERGSRDEVEDCAGDLDVGKVVYVVERERWRRGAGGRDVGELDDSGEDDEEGAEGREDVAGPESFL